MFAVSTRGSRYKLIQAYNKKIIFLLPNKEIRTLFVDLQIILIIYTINSFPIKNIFFLYFS